MRYLKLNNGAIIYTGGKYRLIENAGLLYVVGYGFCIASGGSRRGRPSGD